MNLTVTGWRCLNCPTTWTGSAFASVKPLELADVGRAVREHVLAEHHAAVPVAIESGQGVLPL